jgi:hypothetical protein
VGQQLVDPRGGLRLLAEEDVREVGDGVYAVHLALRDERVEAGEVLAGLVVSDEEPVSCAQGGGAERAIRRSRSPDVLRRTVTVRQ